MEKKTYYAQQSGWILGAERRKGEAIEATPEEAKYALIGGTISTEKPLTIQEQKEVTAQANEPDPAADPEPEAEEQPARAARAKSK